MSTRPPNTPLNRGQLTFEVQERWNQQNGKATAKERRALLEKERDEQNQRQVLVDQGLARELKHHTLGIWLILFFAFFAIFSWTVICVLCYRPIGVSSYYDETRAFTKDEWQNNDRWRKAANVISSIVGTISIPVTSAICAKAAAIHCQRKSDKRAPSLTLRQTLALADKGWSDLAVLRNVLVSKTSHQTRSPLLMISIGLVGLGLLIPALQSAFTDTVHIKVSSWDDIPLRLGSQNTPGMIATQPSSSIVDSVTLALVEGKLSDRQPYLWLSGADGLNITSIATVLSDNIMDFERLPAILYTATFPVGTDSGVIRQLALRLHTSVNCEVVGPSSFPSSCPGQSPFDRIFTNIDDDSDSNPFDPSKTNSSAFRARICAPGDMTTSPWHATSSRQKISEEFWLDVQFSPALDTSGSNFTQHCHSNSTLGYFELPNYWNGHRAGNVFDELPAANGPHASYYDLDELTPLNGLPEALSPGIQGPLLTSISAIFGNNTFFDTVARYSNQSSPDNVLCQQLRRPFTGLYDESYGPEEARTGSIWWNESTPNLDCDPTSKANNRGVFLAALFEWLPNFRDPVKATAALTLASYYSNNAILNFAPDYSGFPLYYDPGFDMQKLTIPLPAIIVITILLVGLALVAHYAARHPTWTESLDSFALLRLGASIAEDIPLVSALQAKEAKILDEKAGWIGDAGSEGRKIRQLVLGGSERVREHDLYRLIPDEDDHP